ncbi:CCA tRNA nucleotidyltransferase [Aestuariibius insulae]|uniref:CCA tRNA nucleotidyltransferase n=1 Tax=Aestuariibius insulae TaxID=2058287 RepID=UPI00345EB0D7
MKISADWLTDPRAQQITASLASQGHQALFVGGCVRNALLRKPVADIDIATSATPQQVIAAAETANLKAIPTGIDHGTITVVADDLAIEITTFRRDVATDGRRATVAFATSVEEDARRRDFTMNALYAQPDGTLLDPLKGLPDLNKRIVRFIEDPATRILEDALRILRFFRFHAWYGNPDRGLDPEGFAACADLAYLTDNLSSERVTGELLKLLSAPDPGPAVAAMAQAGLLTRLMPGADATALPVLVYHEQATQTGPHALRRLACLGGETAHLRLSRKDQGRLTTLRARLSDPADPGMEAYRHGTDIARDAELIRSAYIGMPPGPDTFDRIDRAGAQAFPVRAADLPDLEGPDLGRMLKQLETDWILSDFTLSKAELLAQV